ncbi:MAG TPA: transglutaminase domain-containing protein [Spirochaetota bacterium]|nr:transglutaminase domain-containing protein [Spirochaetota bacterium]HOR44976.1 transglutaminase domain-containing protein [Spirochaetota bacterium]HPK56697.1 transglutaminase domain-containing protein [Spirochaetota bacterium]
MKTVRLASIAVLFVSHSIFADQAGDILKTADAFKEKKDYVSAEKMYLQAEEADPESGFITARKAQFFLLTLKDYARASAAYESAYSKGFRESWLFIQAGNSWRYLKNYENSEKWFRLGISEYNQKIESAKKAGKPLQKLNDGLVSIYAQFCSAMIDLKKFSNADAVASECIKRFTDTANSSFLNYAARSNYWRSVESFGAGDFESAADYAEKARNLAVRAGKDSAVLADEFATLIKVIKAGEKSKSVKPLCVHRMKILIIPETDAKDEGNAVHIKSSVTDEDVFMTNLSAKFVKRFIEASTGGKLGMDIVVDKPSIKLTRIKDNSDIETENRKNRTPDLDYFVSQNEDYFKKAVNDFDTFVLIWSAKEFNVANGGQRQFKFASADVSVMRGYNQITAERISYNGPDLLLHEFFHTIEKLGRVPVQHGYYKENRHNYPEWKGVNGNDYYFWQLSENIPKILRDKFSEDYSSFSFIKKYPADFTRPVRAVRVRPELPVFRKIDRLAADERSAVYRTGVIDSAAENAPKDSAAAMFAKPEDAAVKEFVKALLAGVEDPFRKAKIIHDWITLNIAYDSDLLIRLRTDADPDGGKDALSALKYRRTNCAGLADLYKMLGRYAGLDVRYVTGSIKTGGTPDGGLMSHAWNIVKIEGKEYIVDCSPDSRKYYTGKKTGALADYASRSDHLFIHPEAKRIAYLASNPKDQIALPPLDFNQFSRLPRFAVASYKYGIKFKKHTNAVYSVIRKTKPGGGIEVSDLYTLESQPLEIECEAPDDSFADITLLDEAGKKIDYYTSSQRNGGSFIFMVSAPRAGIFTVVINARSLSQPERVNEIYRFAVNSAVAMKPCAPAVQRGHYADILAIKSVSVNRTADKKRIEIEIDHPSQTVIVSIVRDAQDRNQTGSAKKKTTDTGTMFTYDISPDSKDIIVISGRRSDDTSGRGNQRLLTIRSEDVK